MSSAAELLTDLSARGIHLRCDGDTLWLRPKVALSARLLAEVRSHKPELLRLLRVRCGRCVWLEEKGVPVLTCRCGYGRRGEAS